MRVVSEKSAEDSIKIPERVALILEKYGYISRIDNSEYRPAKGHCIKAIRFFADSLHEDEIVAV